MSWASSRRTLIIGIIAVALLILIGGFAYLFLQTPPSCMDGKQNETEEGIDCGGTCTYLCTANLSAPRVAFVRAVVTNGRTDVIAYIENPNDAAARAVNYEVELYGADRTVLAKKSGTIDIPPRDHGITPLYIPNAYSGDTLPAQTFLTFDQPRWYDVDAIATPRANSPVIAGTVDAPRVTATFENTSAETVRRVRAIAVVFDTEGNAIAASQTILPDLEGFGSGEAVFTWNEPFSASVSRVDVRAVPLVPAP